MVAMVEMCSTADHSSQSQQKHDFEKVTLYRILIFYDYYVSLKDVRVKLLQCFEFILHILSFKTFAIRIMASADPSFVVSLLSGGAAGTAVDIALYPLDTLKTRLQSKAGFWKSGGFRGIYSGVGPAALGSSPNAAVFFCTYDTVKRFGLPLVSPQYAVLVHMSAASLGELAACIVRVPVEVIKQRRQTTAQHLSALSVARRAIATEGVWRGLYRGFGSTILREIPFSIIQFSLWEMFKVKLAEASQVQTLNPAATSLCGALAGGIAAAVTTPLDVAKTRIMLAESGEVMSITLVLKDVYKQAGLSGLYAGLVPRVLWISIGGAVFFGVYECVKVNASPFFS